jgi:hypothetical protein
MPTGAERKQRAHDSNCRSEVRVCTAGERDQSRKAVYHDAFSKAAVRVCKWH